MREVQPDYTYATWAERLFAYVLDSLIAMLTLGIGWLIWLFWTIPNGQTPGKKALGIRMVKVDGSAFTCWTFGLREILARGIVIYALGVVTLGIVWVIDILLPLWDKQAQSLHDKMAGTYVVKVEPVTRS